MATVESRTIQDVERSIVQLYHELIKYTALYKESVSNTDNWRQRLMDSVRNSLSMDGTFIEYDPPNAPVTDSVRNPAAFANRVFWENTARENGLKDMVDTRLGKYLDLIDEWRVLRSFEYSDYTPSTEGFCEAMPPDSFSS